MAKVIPLGVKRLPWDELQKRREKGLCFNCDEKFTLGHRCKVKQAFLIEPVESSEEEDLVEYEFQETPEISVHALAGVRGSRTMRFESWIYGRRAIVLIDSGSTHNFISQEVAKKLNLDSTIIEPFSVRVANRDQISCKEVYKKNTYSNSGSDINGRFILITIRRSRCCVRNSVA